MIKDKKIDIIVPVYNTEEYLARCLNSILSQKFDDYNVILIDDGSRDNSGDICEKYSSKYNNVFTYHTSNHGLAAARNYGINVSNSKYVGFIDSDDWIEKRMIEYLVNDAYKNNADISACNMYTAYSFSNKKVKNEVCDFNGNKIKIYKDADVLKNYYYKFSVCNKIFKRSLFDNIMFPEGKIFEDARTTYLLADKSNIATFNKYNGYNYFKRSNSITSNISEDYLYDKIIVWNEIAKLVLEKLPEEKDYIIYRKNKVILEALDYLARKNCSDDIKNKIISEIEPFLNNQLINIEDKEKLKSFVK